MAQPCGMSTEGPYGSASHWEVEAERYRSHGRFRKTVCVRGPVDWGVSVVCDRVREICRYR